MLRIQGGKKLDFFKRLMEKRGRRRRREIVSEGSVERAGSELVVGALFLCSYRDYKDCNASNSAKRRRGRPTAAAEDPERKTMKLALQCNGEDCVVLCTSVVVHPSWPQITFMSDSDRGHRVATSINVISTDWNKRPKMSENKV